MIDAYKFILSYISYAIESIIRRGLLLLFFTIDASYLYFFVVHKQHTRAR